MDMQTGLLVGTIIGIIIGKIVANIQRDNHWKDQAVFNQKAEYYLDGHNKKWRWLI